MKTFKRRTVISDKVMELLSNSKKPISILQLLSKLKAKKLEPNKSTVYRIIEKLKEKKMVNELVFRNGIAYYELLSNHHHHHFFCNECEFVFCMDTCHLEKNKINVNNMLPNNQFKVFDHDFNLYGTCDNCLKKDKS
ncbi:hypothetical protein DID75_04935 [Candidatus Marinamargulisbacteria bacterium SCGC AG-410-N11]|nr:hypothetical protein DID75_04935 [Candidatus Marinamargulisbacteria bacterium SCGC AG-410-N11]